MQGEKTDAEPGSGTGADLGATFTRKPARRGGSDTSNILLLVFLLFFFFPPFFSRALTVQFQTPLARQ